MGNRLDVQCLCRSTPRLDCRGEDEDEKSFSSRYDTHMFPKVLGEGMFSKTYSCWRRHSPDEVYALKVYSQDDDGAKQHARNEIKVLSYLGQHPRIVNLVDVDDGGPTPRIVQELCEGGSLYDRLLKRGRYEEWEAAIVVDRTLEAVVFMHGHGLMHRDLKPENILLVSTDSDTEVKVCDFGISKLSASKKLPPTSSSFTGSIHYVAPEIIRQEEYSCEVDIWALGVTLYALLSGSLPFNDPEDDMIEIMRKIVKADLHFDAEAWEEISEVGLEFTRSLLSPTPSTRPTAAKARASVWLQACLLAEEDEEESPSPSSVRSLDLSRRLAGA